MWSLLISFPDLGLDLVLEVTLLLPSQPFLEEVREGMPSSPSFQKHCQMSVLGLAPDECSSLDCGTILGFKKQTQKWTVKAWGDDLAGRAVILS